MMKEKILIYVSAFGRFLLRRVLPFYAAVLVLIGISFFIWQGFSSDALSERCVWSGIAFFLVSGILVFSQASGGRDFGVPGQFMNTAHASVLHEWNREIRRDVDRQFDFRVQIFTIGMFVFLTGILVQALVP
jgi:hypothetical protein